MNRLAFHLQQVTKRNHDEFTLAIDQLQIAAGRVHCLLGPTGAGKSTLLRLLAGLEPPSSGQFLFDGQPLYPDGTAPRVQRRITLVFQRPLLLARSVHDNVAYGLRVRGVAGREERVERLCKRLGLAGLARRHAQTLSGGQAQLVSLARALVIEPEVLLLDEPTANLDPAHVALVEEVIAEDHARRGTTIVWATHNLFQARRVGHHVGLLLDGRLVEQAPRQEFFESPADLRTRDFVEGKMIY